MIKINIKDIKKILLFFLVFGGYLIEISAQNDFIVSGSTWYYTYVTNGDAPWSSYKKYTFEKDTIIGTDMCKLVNVESFNPNSINKIIIKKMDNKVYYYFRDSFNLIFDFEAVETDTIKPTFLCCSSLESNGIPDSMFSARYIVTGIDVININGQFLRQYNAEIIEEDKEIINGIEIPFSTYSYLEKIGYAYEFLPIINLFPEETSSTKNLRCYEDNEIYYITDWWQQYELSCDYSNHNSFEISNMDCHIEIYPSPFRNQIIINTIEEANILVRNCQGEIVKSFYVRYGENQINMDSLLSGIYFFEIIFNRLKPQVFKIIKQ